MGGSVVGWFWVVLGELGLAGWGVEELDVVGIFRLKSRRLLERRGWVGPS